MHTKAISEPELETGFCLGGLDRLAALGGAFGLSFACKKGSNWDLLDNWSLGAAAFHSFLPIRETIFYPQISVHTSTCTWCAVTCPLKIETKQ